MQTQVVCECGNEVTVSAEQADTEYRCPRCGRRVFVSELEAKAYFDTHSVDSDHIVEEDLQQPVSASQVASTQSAAGSALAMKRSALHEAQSDPDATVIQSVCPETLAADKKETNIADTIPATGAGIPPVLPALNDDFEVTHQPADDSSSISGSTPSTLKYDLSQRVMRPIAKPVLPTIPYTGAGEYGIHRILRVHQKGGMGRILVAYDQYLKRDVAIKELHPDVAEDESIVRRFIGEAEITAQLEHPGVVPIHRLGQGRDGLPYYTMKMIKGETLQEAIKAYHRKPTRPELLNLVRRLVSVAKTMAFAHSKGVIHRDLKPANIMLGEHGETLVMDWGLAKPVSQGIEESFITIVHRTKQPRPELTMVGAIVGTPAFMSPEQAMAEDNVVGPLSDVFSLGTVLYYLLAGQTAFSGRSTQEVLNKVREAIVTPPSQIKPNVPHDLEVICLKAMAKSPEDRYQGASEFSDDLCRWLDDEPVTAKKSSLLRTTWRWMKQYSLWTVGLPCVLLLSLVLSGFEVWVAKRHYVAPIVVDAGAQDTTEFKENLQIKGSPKIHLWSEFLHTDRHTKELSLICQVKATESEKHHSVSIYAPADGWDLSERHVLKFSLLEIVPENGTTLQNFSIRLGQGESYYEYKPSDHLWNDHLKNREKAKWSRSQFTIPLELERGYDGWSRHGSANEPTMTNIEYLKIQFDTDSETLFNLGNIKFE